MRLMPSYGRGVAGLEGDASHGFCPASVTVGGLPEEGWVFSISTLPGDHIVSVALAPAEKLKEKQACAPPLISTTRMLVLPLPSGTA
jgi:hypothetical protein